MALAALLALALLWNAAAAAEAVRRGVTLCLTSVIPALFPFFVCTGMLNALGLTQRIANAVCAAPDAHRARRAA